MSSLIDNRKSLSDLNYGFIPSDDDDEPKIVEEDPIGKKFLLNPTDTDLTTSNPGYTNNNEETGHLADPDYWLHDMEYLYLRSFNELEAVFRADEFKESKAFKDMVIELNSNMVEYKFLYKAGILKAS